MVQWGKVFTGAAIVGVGLSPIIPAFDDLPALLIGGPLIIGGLFGEEEEKEAAAAIGRAAVRK
jgi:hypothetical protein